MSFTVILCEGYHDRSFLAGALVERLGWTEPKLDATGRRAPARDAWGSVAGGDFGFRHQDKDAELRLRPCHGHSKIPDELRRLLQGRDTRAFDRVIVNYDGDKGGNAGDFLTRISDSVETSLAKLGVPLERTAAGRWVIDGGRREVRTLVWHASDPPTCGVPDQQCLERLLCAAAASLWPERLASLGDWIKRRPDPRSSLSAKGTSAKSFNWTLMGGWFAEHGCDDFFRQVWAEPEFSRELESRLKHSGVWDVLSACAEPVLAP